MENEGKENVNEVLETNDIPQNVEEKDSNNNVNDNIENEPKLNLEDYLSEEDLVDGDKKQITISLTTLIKIILGVIMFGLLFFILLATYTA